MTLDQYHAKRDFRITAEPRGEAGVSGKVLSFVIQRHAASHLHYDFRLELGGTLKSWAIPKGPHLDPAVKRLAVQVEDHPLDYARFEGVIPSGQYGAGRVVLWDRGYWTPLGDPLQGYRTGNLKFHLAGEKLRGAWVLVRMKKNGVDKENWLLIKERDDEARSGEEADITRLRPESVQPSPTTTQQHKVNATVRQRRIDHSATTVESEQASCVDPTGAEPQAMPLSFQPQLATLSDHAPLGDDWLTEIKFDGYRALCRIDQSTVKMFTRSGHDWTEKWQVLADCARHIDVDQAWLDGEVVAIDADGKSNFQALQHHIQKDGAQRLAYYVFDLLYLNGFDLTAVPLIERKRLLAECLSTLAPNSPIIFSDHLQGSAQKVLDHAVLHGLEGIVAKRARGHYVQARTPGWLKIKCTQRQEFVIAGYTSPAGSREHFGALLLGVYVEGNLTYAGRVGTGFTTKVLATLHGQFQSRVRPKSPFAHPLPPPAARGVTWLAPKLVAEVQFAEWTESGAIRHGSFVALRQDKLAVDVRREIPDLVTQHQVAPHNRQVDRSNRVCAVVLTHPTRLLYPDIGLTKLALARYYEHIAPWILPHLHNRPLSLVRCPNGEGSACFFQKHATDATSSAIERVTARHKNGAASCMMANSLDAVIAMVQMGVLELHTWGATVPLLSTPDRIVMDLDPAPGVPWERVTEAALLLHGLFEELGLQSFVKTTGGKGLHVVVPIRPVQDWDQVKAVSKGIAAHLAHTLPDRFTTNIAKRARTNKIFIDYLRNASGATTVAAYSTRSRPGAPVSVPLRWDEVGDAVRADTFNVATVLKRLDDLAEDPWREYFLVDQHLTTSSLTLFAG